MSISYLYFSFCPVFSIRSFPRMSASSLCTLSRLHLNLSGVKETSSQDVKLCSRELSYSFLFMFSIVSYLHVMIADHTGTESSVRPFHVSAFCSWLSGLCTLSPHFFWSHVLIIIFRMTYFFLDRPSHSHFFWWCCSSSNHRCSYSVVLAFPLLLCPLCLHVPPAFCLLDFKSGWPLSS